MTASPERTSLKSRGETSCQPTPTLSSTTMKLVQQHVGILVQPCGGSHMPQTDCICKQVTHFKVALGSEHINYTCTMNWTISK